MFSMTDGLIRHSFHPEWGNCKTCAFEELIRTTSLKNTFSCAPSGTEWLRLPLDRVPGFLSLRRQIIPKLLCSPEITSWVEARVTTVQVEDRQSSPLSWFLTPQGNKLLCAIWGTSGYLSFGLCPQNLPGMTDVLQKPEIPVKELSNFTSHLCIHLFMQLVYSISMQSIV